MRILTIKPSEAQIGDFVINTVCLNTDLLEDKAPEIERINSLTYFEGYRGEGIRARINGDNWDLDDMIVLRYESN